MTITARKNSTCGRCHNPITVGEEIDWDRGTYTATHTDCEPAPRPEPEGDLKRVVDHLNERALKNPTEFETSLLVQYNQRGDLTERQINAVLRKLDRDTLPGKDLVPAGYYALHNERFGTYFVKVWRHKKDPTYVRCYLVHGPNESEVSCKSTLEAIIEAGPANAARRYGRLIGKCSQCDTRLTNALSRFLSIGPVCGGHFYSEAAWGEMKREAREWLTKHGIDPMEDLPEGIDLEAIINAEPVAA
jgi:hypothetical protein